MEHQRVTVDAKSLAKILRTCKECGVAKLKWGDTIIEMRESESVSHQPKVNEITQSITPTEIEEAANETNLQENLEAIGDIEDTLHIEDPVSFERLLIEKELEPSETAQH